MSYGKMNRADKIELARMLAHDAKTLEWGSEEQIEAENTFCEVAEHLGCDMWDLWLYAFKAKTEEWIDYALSMIEE